MDNTVDSADGTKIAFTAAGTGSALVIVGGAMSHRELNSSEQDLARALAEHHKVYTFDRRGRGESGDADAYSVQSEVDDIAALVEHAGGEAILLGMSSGGVLALEAARAGLPISRLAMYEPPFVVSTDRAPISSDYRERVQHAVAKGRPGDAVTQFLTEAVGMPAEVVATMSTEPEWSAMEQLAPTLANDAAVMGETMSGDPAALQRYASVTTPSLVLHGGASEAWLAAGAAAIAEILPHSDRQVLPGQDHDISAQIIVPILTKWLSISHN